MSLAPYLTRPARLLRGPLLVAVLLLAPVSAALAGSGGGGLGGGGTPTTSRTPPARGGLTIAGAGDGHGVGMSQYGAEGYALHGAGDTEILAHYYAGTGLGHVSPGTTVRVLISDGPRATFSGASRAGAARLSAAETYTVRAIATGLRLTNAVTGRAVAVSASAGIAADLTVSGPGVIAAAGHSYHGTLQFGPDGRGGVRTVNVVGLDDYVRGVVPAEVPSSWAPAALEAQAIAARTYAITTGVGGDGFSLYDDTRSQVYDGVSSQTAPTDAAVTATAGEVVTYDGTPAVTYFFASSGGHTESVQNVWPGGAPEPWLTGVPDPYDGAAGDPYEHWQVKLSLAAATRKLGSLVDGTLRRILVTRTGVSPRVVTAQVVGSRGTHSVSGTQLQAAFGLPSTWMRFSVSRPGA